MTCASFFLVSPRWDFQELGQIWSFDGIGIWVCEMGYVVIFFLKKIWDGGGVVVGEGFWGWRCVGGFQPVWCRLGGDRIRGLTAFETRVDKVVVHVGFRAPWIWLGFRFPLAKEWFHAGLMVAVHRRQESEDVLAEVFIFSCPIAGDFNSFLFSLKI
jgi:hypothetical protein